MRTGDRLVGRYRLDARIGRGGMGEVWQGHDLSLNRPVAVKALLGTEANEEIVARFRREALIGARLQHPGITVVHDIGHDDGQLFIVMELLDGEDLARALGQSPGGLPVLEVLALAVQAAEALAAAHEAGVVHRDLKPGNLFLLSTGRLKICDFGIARPADATAGLTQTGRMFGTPLYMAPEQWRGEHVDAKCDLYALGCVVYALLTGAPPFGADGDFFALGRQHLEDPPPPLPDAVVEAAPGLDVLVARLLSKDPADRPDSALAVAEALTALYPAVPERPPLATEVAVPGSRFVVAAAMLREAAEAACLSGYLGTLAEIWGLAARFDATLAQELMGLAEQQCWKDAQGDRARLAWRLADLAAGVRPFAPKRTLRLAAEAQQVLFAAAASKETMKALVDIAKAIAPLQPQRAFDLMRRHSGHPANATDDVLVEAVAGFAAKDPQKAERWLSEIQGIDARFTALKKLAEGRAEDDLTAALQIVERLPQGKWRAEALGYVGFVRLRHGDMVGTSKVLELAAPNVLIYAQEIADMVRAQATEAETAGRDRLAKVLHKNADTILEEVRQDPCGLCVRLPFISPGFLFQVRDRLEVATGVREPAPRPTLADIQQRVQAARAGESLGPALAALAAECLGPWTGWAEDLDHPGTSAWPPDAVPIRIPATSSYGRQRAVPGTVLWSHDQLESEDFFTVGDGVGWSCENRVGVIDAATGAPLWTAVGDDGVNGPPITTTHRGTALGMADKLFRTLLPTAGDHGRLLAHQSTDGRLLWSHHIDTRSPETRAPALACVDNLLMYTDANTVKAVDAATGAQRWSEFARPAPRLRTAAPGCLIVSYPDGSFVGMHPSTGRKRWSWRPGARPVPTGFIAGDPPGTVHLRDGESLHALDTTTGAPLWSRHVGQHATVPFATDGVVITGTYNPAQGGDIVTAVAEHSGEVVWQKVINRRTQYEADTACALQLIGAHGGLLYVKSANGGRHRLRGVTRLPFVIALDLTRGKPRWLWEHPGLDTRPSMLHGTTLLVQIPYLAAVALPHP